MAQEIGVTVTIVLASRLDHFGTDLSDGRPVHTPLQHRASHCLADTTLLAATGTVLSYPVHQLQT
jgi:hypothetical protein